jgi:hypothetical protein
MNPLAQAALQQLPLGQLAGVVQNGSASVLKFAGRAIGLGDAGQEALAKGKVPWWAISIGALAIGVVAGIQWESRSPGSVPKFLKGK